MELWSVATAAMIIAIAFAIGTVGCIGFYWYWIRLMFKDKD